MALADLNGPDAQLLPDLVLWKDIAPILDADGMLDMFVPKATPEYLVSGNAYTRHQDNKSVCMVQIEVAGLSKSLRVTGQRYWINGRATEPKDFDSMPLIRSNAFGGASHEENPSGKGKGQPLNSDMLELPNIEYPMAPFVKPGVDIPVAGFGPLSFLDPARQRMMGTYSEQWLKQDFPGFFADMDPSIFNMAREEQRWEKRPQAPLGETFTIWNMHPDEPTWQGQIPDWMARCFIMQDEQFREIEMQATTVWFLPEQKRILLIYHGSTPISEDDAFDVNTIMPALELAGQSRPAEYYEQVMSQRSDPVRGGLYAFRDQDLIPRSLIGKWLDSETSVKQTQLWQKAHLRAETLRNNMRQQAADQGLDPDDYFPILMGPEREYTPSDLPELMEETEGLEKSMQEKKVAMRDSLLSAGGAETDSEYENLIESIFLGEGYKPKGPPKDVKEEFDLDKKLAQLEQDDEFKKAVGAENDLTVQMNAVRNEIGKSPSSQNPELKSDYYLSEKEQSRMQKLDPLRRRMYLYSAHLQDGAAIASVHESERRRNQILDKYRQDKDLTALDLTGTDLSGLDLSGADFSGSFLEAVDLSACRLDDCNFSQAVLTRAKLDQASLRGVNFHKANLSGIHASEAIFEDVKITEAIFEGSAFSHCHFEQAQFSDLLAGKISFKNCNFNNASFDMIIINDLELTECDMQNLAVFKLSLNRARIHQCQFSGATLDSCMFFDSSLEQADFDEVNFFCVGFAYHTVFSACSFRRSILKNSNFRDMDLQNTDFSGARLDSCDFSNANLSGCIGVAMRTPQSMFIRTNLRNANLHDSDLMYANFKKAELRGARLENTNVFRANMEQVMADDSTRLENSYREQVNIYPLRNITERRNK